MSPTSESVATFLNSCTSSFLKYMYISVLCSECRFKAGFVKDWDKSLV